uniref:Little elongation complex subunit 2 C-terminal domain-containing protein n=1 Tax=Romanomermis culicivorax TaxID=13658 RepID=A0A915HN20_ROMCU
MGSNNYNHIFNIEPEEWDPKDFSITNPNYMINCYQHYCERMHNLYGNETNEQETATKPDEDLPLASIINNNTENIEKLNENVATESTTNQPTIDDNLVKDDAKEKTKTNGEKPKRFENSFKKLKRECSKDDVSLKRPKDKPEPIKRDIPVNQRHTLPRFHFLGARRSQLTIKQHDIHVATMLNLAKVQRSTGHSVKDYEQRLKLLQVEHEIFNRLAREHILRDKGKYLDNFNMSYAETVKTRNYFFAKLNKIQHIYPQKYKFSSEFDAANLAAMQNSPTLEYQKLLLETGKIPKVVMPNIEKRFLVVDHQSYNPRELDLRESISLKNDSNVPKLCEKYAPNFVLNFSAAKTLLSGHGPLKSNDWMLPVYVNSCFIQGRKTRIVYIMKPLPNTSLDAWQVLNHSFKRTLLNCLIDQPSAGGSSGGGGGRRQTANGQQDSAAIFDDASTVDLDAAEKFTGDDWLRSQRVEKVEEKMLVENNVNVTPTLEKTSEPKSVNDVNIDQNAENDALEIVENDETDIKPAVPHHYPRRACAAASTEKIRQYLFSPRRSAPPPVPPAAELSTKNTPLPDIPSTSNQHNTRSVGLSRCVSSNESETAKLTAQTSSINIEKSSVDDVLSKILDDGKKTVGDKSKILKNAQMKPKQHIIDPDEHAVENVQDYCLSKSGAKIVQYNLWQMKNFRLLVRSNVCGLYKTEYNDQLITLTKQVRATVLPKLEFCSHMGGQKDSEYEILNHFWTSFLKRSFVHLKIHINPNSTDLVGAQILKSDYFLRLEKLESNIRSSIGEGMGRFHTILNELYALDNDGWYLLKPNLQNRNLISIYQPVQDGSDISDSIVDLSKIYSRYSWLDNFKSAGDLDFDEICPPFDPKVVFQWNRILKRIPCALNPRKDNETPLLEPVQAPKETKASKKKKKKLKSKEEKEKVKQNKKDDDDDDANYSSEIDP